MKLHVSSVVALHAVLRMAALAACTIAAPTFAQAQARVEMELGTQRDFPFAQSHTWQRMLAELQVDNVRIRPQVAGDELKIETLGSPAAPTYKVHGVLTSRNELMVPGGHFTAGNRGGIAQWLATLRSEGPGRAQGDAPLPFGMAAAQLEAVRRDLSRPVSIATQGASLDALLSHLGSRLTYPLVAQPGAAAKVSAAEPIANELSGLAAGSALAIGLNSAGLALVPRLDARREPQYMIAVPDAKTEAWPIGWPPERPAREVLPGMFELVNIEITDVPMSRVLGVVSQRVETPFLLDAPSLARIGADLEKKVTAPRRQSTYDTMLNYVLFQLRLKYELRVDEAGKPFCWVKALGR